MFSLEDLLILRREAQRLLEDVQDVPGFLAAFEALPKTPDVAETWPWSAIKRVCWGQTPGVVRWVPAQGTTPRRVVELRAPVDKALPRFRAYRAKIESFARHYLFNANWSASSVHEARSGQAPKIRLPQSAYVPRDEQEREAFARFEEERQELLDQAADAFERRRAGSSSRGAANPVVRYRAAAFPGSRLRSPRRRTPGRRDDRYAGALEDVAHKLGARAAVPQAERARLRLHYHRVAQHLNDAVNGYPGGSFSLRASDAHDRYTDRALRYGLLEELLRSPS